MEAQADTISSFFSWFIENFYTLAGDEHTSEPFVAGDYLWEVCIFPNADELSISLQVADQDNLPVGWSRYANFDCSVVDLVDSHNTVRREIVGQKFVAVELWRKKTTYERNFSSYQSTIGISAPVSPRAEQYNQFPLLPEQFRS